MDKDLLLYKLDMQSKFKSWIISYAEKPLHRAQSGHIAKRRTIENGQIKMIVEEKGKLLLEPQP